MICLVFGILIGICISYVQQNYELYITPIYHHDHVTDPLDSTGISTQDVFKIQTPYPGTLNIEPRLRYLERLAHPRGSG